MKLFVTLSRKNLFIILLITVIILLILIQTSNSRINRIDGSTNARRVDFLESVGVSAEDSAVESKNIIIPEKFSAVYEQYNALQLEAGFDLSRYKGEEAVLYTYPITGDTEAHIIVYEGMIIGGDIASVRLGGSMKPLK